MHLLKRIGDLNGLIVFAIFVISVTVSVEITFIASTNAVCIFSMVGSVEAIFLGASAALGVSFAAVDAEGEVALSFEPPQPLSKSSEEARVRNRNQKVCVTLFIKLIFGYRRWSRCERPVCQSFRSSDYCFVPV